MNCETAKSLQDTDRRLAIMVNGFPHEFSTLRDTSQRIVLFCGAGLSAGIVPTVNGFFEEIRQSAEQKLGLSGEICEESWARKDAQEQFYFWAECVLHKAEESAVIRPKLRLAQALGITSDPRWWGDSGIDFRGNTPRHRIVARMAKEGRWQSIWSFNWDCIMEKALESVGVASEKPSFNTPWLLDHYHVHISNNDLHLCQAEKVLCVRKPHGCVTALKEAVEIESTNPIRSRELSERLMIKQSELTKRASDPVDNRFYECLGTDLAGHVNLVVGWRMGEEALRSHLVEVTKDIDESAIDIIDLEFDNDTHGEICSATGQNYSDAFFRVQREGCPTTDDLFRWIQALYALDRLTVDGVPLIDRAGIEWKESVSVCGDESFFIDWADEFLPTWSRLCWSAGLVQCHGFEPHQIDLERRDEHIPLFIQNIARPDLIAAISILEALPARGGEWDAKSFPGGLLHRESRCLVIPLPCWEAFNELRALKPMVEAITAKIGFIGRIVVYPVGYNEREPEEDVIQHLRLRVAELMPVPAFATLDAMAVIYSLEDEVFDGTTD